MISGLVNANREPIIRFVAVGSNGQEQEIVEAANTEPLVGTSLLDRHSLRIDVFPGGVVPMTALP